jgi:3-oxoacyl-[acyl-carrier protein] reductase
MSELHRVQGPAIVTGGGQGLGRAFCLALAEAGVAVAVADLNLDKANKVAAEINQTGSVGLGVGVDVADEASVSAMSKSVHERLGAPAVLVNNAAIFSTLALKPFEQITAQEWRLVMDVNVTGAFLCSRAVVPLMREASYGKIVNVSSATIWTGRPGYLHYVTSKAALIGMTRSLASELGPDGIRVNAITPGSTQTEVERATISAEARQAMAQQTALRRVQTPEDLIGAVLFLASAASDFITGQAINIDGGLAFH